jgi:hypothetical protein
VTADRGTLNNWVEPDPEVVDLLVGWATPGADMAMLSGGGFRTAADATRAAVRAALRVLLANGFIEPRIPTEPDEVWVSMDPPGGWL